MSSISSITTTTTTTTTTTASTSMSRPEDSDEIERKASSRNPSPPAPNHEHASPANSGDATTSTGAATPAQGESETARPLSAFSAHHSSSNSQTHQYPPQQRASTATGFRVSSSSTTSSYSLFPSRSPHDSVSSQTSAISLQRATLKNAVAELGKKGRSSSLERSRARSPTPPHLQRTLQQQQHAVPVAVPVAVRLPLSDPPPCEIAAPAAVSAAVVPNPQASSASPPAAEHPLPPSSSSPSSHDYSTSHPLDNTSSTPLTPPAGQSAHVDVSPGARNSKTSGAPGLLITPMSTVLEAGDSPTVSAPAAVPIIATYSYPPTLSNVTLSTNAAAHTNSSSSQSQSHSQSSSVVSALTAAAGDHVHGWHHGGVPYDQPVPSPVSPLHPRDQAFVAAMNNPKPQYVWSSRHAAAEAQTLHGLGLSAIPSAPASPIPSLHKIPRHEEQPPPPPPKSPRHYHPLQSHMVMHSRDSSDNSISKFSLKSDGTVLDAEFISPAKPTLFDLQMMPGYRPQVQESNVAQRPTIVTHPDPQVRAIERKPLAPAQEAFSEGDRTPKAVSPNVDSALHSHPIGPLSPAPTGKVSKRKHKPAPLQIHPSQPAPEPELLTSAVYSPLPSAAREDPGRTLPRSESPLLSTRPALSHTSPMVPARASSALSNVISAATRTNARSPEPEVSTRAPSRQAATGYFSTLDPGAGKRTPTPEIAMRPESAQSQQQDRTRTTTLRTRPMTTEEALKSPTVKAAADATDSLRDLANAMNSLNSGTLPRDAPKIYNPDVEREKEGGPDPMDTLKILTKQSESLHQRYAGLRQERQKITSQLSAALNDPKPGPDFHKILMDCHISLNTVNSSMDICFAKLQSLDCRKEEAIHSMKAQMATKMRLIELAQKANTMQQAESQVRTRSSKDSFHQPGPNAIMKARASADSIAYQGSPGGSKNRMSDDDCLRRDSPLQAGDAPRSGSGLRTSDSGSASDTGDILARARSDLEFSRPLRPMAEKAANMPATRAVPRDDRSTSPAKQFSSRLKKSHIQIQIPNSNVGSGVLPPPSPAPTSPLPELPPVREMPSLTGQLANTSPLAAQMSATLFESRPMKQDGSPQRLNNGARQPSPRAGSGTSTDSSGQDEPPEMLTRNEENKVLTGAKPYPIQVYVDDDVFPSLYRERVVPAT